jgi:hypothetical protein
MRQKYGNKPTRGYDSKKEANYATYLHALEKSGKISELKEQVRFVLVQAQYRDGVCIERAMSYVADFSYVDENGELRIVDVKGCRTEVFKIKKKLMLYFYNIKIEEV